VLTNLRQGLVYAQPTSEDERAEVAEACVLGLDLQMPMVLDDMSNEVDEAYSALPERLYVIDAEGTIVWRSGPGPWGFDLDGFEAALRAQAELG
jgi:type I thyroxine 5'-deiodinase